MNAIVVYTSKTGFTETYAKHIATQLGCEALPAAQATAARLSAYDTVIYGGWVFASKIKGLEKIRPLCKGKLLVFAVGATTRDKVDLDAMRASNKLSGTPLFYLEGGFRFERLGAFTRWMLSNIGKMAAKKQPEGAESDPMLQAMGGTSVDHTDLSATEPLIAAARGV